VKALLKLLVSTASILVAAYIIPGVSVSNVLTAVIVAIVLGVLNTFIRPVLLLLTLPINIVSLGLFTFIVNAFLVYLVSAIVPGFDLASFLTALIFSLVVSLVSAFLGMFLDE
jgi:putative membrane protein